MLSTVVYEVACVGGGFVGVNARASKRWSRDSTRDEATSGPSRLRLLLARALNPKNRQLRRLFTTIK